MPISTIWDATASNYRLIWTNGVRAGKAVPSDWPNPMPVPNTASNFPLHEGTEVMLSFVQGNPDRPYISGVMHDSAHTDHIPADWNTRNVIRTWANNKLRMEDQKGQEHIKLATDYQKSQLNLGHIVDSNRNKRGENGEGFELRTDGWGAVRAGKGILVSAQNQDANGKVLNMDDAISQLEQALSLAKSLNKAAQTANNHNTDEETQRGRLKDALKDLKEAGLIQTAPAGIATATEQSQLHTAGENIHLVSGNHTDITAGQSLTAHAAESLNLFAQSSGIKVQANQGKVEVQAQNDELQLNALKDATLTSSAGKITIAAKEEILITCKGAYIKLSNGEVEIGSPKVVRVRAPLVVNGPQGVYEMFNNENIKGELNLEYIDVYGNVPDGEPISLLSKQGEKHTISLDQLGKGKLENLNFNLLTLTQPKREDK